ncbi:MAG: hypothetical protein KDA61_22950, partial [Planctomycetales bacterium]|nr:hypothetical protein [Planctomycetales bacterium]
MAPLPEYQRLVDQIRTAVFNPVDVDEAAELAGQYGAACTQLNERLRGCQQLLTQGLRSEAIEIAEAEPHVLDVAAVLDFPELGPWREQLAAANVNRPPEVLIDAAAALNEAYALERPLEALLAKHRLAALAQAPLSLRIDLLRQIADLDDQNSLWRQDLVAYERTRLRELSGEAKQALKAGDLAALDALTAELAGDWTSSPPESVVKLVGDCRRDASRKRATLELTKLAQQLHEAHAELDYESAVSLARSWERLWPHVAPKAASELREQAAPALEWLAAWQAEVARQRARDRAEAELAAALDVDIPKVELERLYHQLA